MAYKFNPFTGNLDIVGSGSGASTFLGLTDTPADYTGQTGNSLKVNATEDGLEFYTPVTDTDEKVSIDADAIPGYLGSANNDGVLRTGTNLSYSDGGDYITLDVDSTKASNWDTAYGWGNHADANYFDKDTDTATTINALLRDGSNANQNVSLGSYGLTANGTISGGTLTDGTLSVTGGVITGASGSNSMWTNRDI